MKLYRFQGTSGIIDNSSSEDNSEDFDFQVACTPETAEMISEFINEDREGYASYWEE